MHVPACTAAAAAVRRGSAAPPPPAAGREVRGACARELAALELLEQEVEPRLVLERDVKAHDRWVAQRAEQLLLTVQVGQLRLALDVALLDGFERLGGRRAPVPHAQHAARHAAAEHTAELQVDATVHHFPAQRFIALELDTHTEQSRQNKQSTPRAGEVLHGYSDDVH
jgi:hypothetical protein